MTLSFVSLDDSGEYGMAIVPNSKDVENFTYHDYDSLFTEFTELEVLEPIWSTKITGPSETLFVGNSSARLRCEAKTGTVKTRTWQKDGKPVKASSHLMFSDDRSTLTFVLLEKEDNGKYTCLLSNPISSDAASYKMVVNFGPEETLVWGQRSVEVNDRLTLICSAASNPPADFTWSFNGVEIKVKTARLTIEKIPGGLWADISNLLSLQPELY
ncbi:hypothetical protein INR49_009381 [Caranx melampygus]|nr:hypothetical protein INR49_009381 [Caranx melampygus]